jgi:hypothetical protein
MYAPATCEDRPPYPVVFDGRTTWIVKAGGDPYQLPERLAWILGRAICNVAEVKRLSEEELAAVHAAAISMPGRAVAMAATPDNTWLVRLAGSYTLAELPRADSDSATAYELAYSLWIRRRDAHVCNRDYVLGVPVFFDHHIAFGIEADNVDLDRFFRDDGDFGYVPRWRVVESDQAWTTAQVRQQKWLAVHFVRSRQRFEQHFSEAVETIRAIDEGAISAALEEAGVDVGKAAWIRSFLNKTTAELPEATRRVRKIIYRPLQLER